MAYTVSFTATAEADAYAAFERIREVAPASAARWLTGLFAAIRTLADMPARCPVIPEADELGAPLRHLLYGRRTSVYRTSSTCRKTPRKARASACCGYYGTACVTPSPPRISKPSMK